MVVCTGVRCLSELQLRVCEVEAEGQEVRVLVVRANDGTLFVRRVRASEGELGTRVSKRSWSGCSREAQSGLHGCRKRCTLVIADMTRSFWDTYNTLINEVRCSFPPSSLLFSENAKT